MKVRILRDEDKGEIQSIIVMPHTKGEANWCELLLEFIYQYLKDRSGRDIVEYERIKQRETDTNSV